MKLITRNTDYAIRALMFIAKGKKEAISVTDLVKKLKIPRPFLRKILQRLNKRGLLNSYKGQGGGFALAKEPEKLFLVDVIKIFQGELKLIECIFKKNICPNIKLCPLRKKIKVIERYVILQLRSISIASLLR